MKQAGGESGSNTGGRPLSFPTLSQAEEGQDGRDNDHQSDYVDNSVHNRSSSSFSYPA